MPITPIQFLAVLIALTAVARLVFIMRRHAQRRALYDLARRWDMHYSPNDRFQLAGRVAERFPVPGAAEVRVIDLIYGRDLGDGGGYRYVFTAEYTEGLTHGKHRRRRVATFRETRRGEAPAAEEWSAVEFADEAGAIVDQYESIGQRLARRPAPAAAAAAQENEPRS